MQLLTKDQMKIILHRWGDRWLKPHGKQPEASIFYKVSPEYENSEETFNMQYLLKSVGEISFAISSEIPEKKRKWKNMSIKTC